MNYPSDDYFARKAKIAKTGAIVCAVLLIALFVLICAWR